MYNFLQNIIGSVIVTVLITAFTKISDGKLNASHYIVFAFILFIFFSISPGLKRLFNKLIMILIHSCFPRIGILNGNINSPVREYKCKRSNICITPSMWEHELNHKINNKFKQIRFISTSEICYTYPILINPFGDNFPEENLKLHTTFYKMCDYVKDGGIIICTGGSFYSHQNPKNSTWFESVFINEVDGKQNLVNTLLFQEFGITTTGDNLSYEKQKVNIYQSEEDKKRFGQLIDENIECSILRFRSVTRETSNYIPLVREVCDNSFPAAIIKYGKGHLVHFGMLIVSVNSQEFRIITNVVNLLIKNKFRI